MVFASRGEKHRWFATGLCIVLIYSSLYIARPVAEFLRESNVLRLFVVLVFLTVGAVIAFRLAVAKPGWRVLGAAGVVGVGYLALLTLVPMMPEERLHFLEYGAVAALIYMALRERQARGRAVGHPDAETPWSIPPLIMAVLITGALGWIDEGIQAVLPERVYDLRDVAFNIAAAVICLLSLQWLEWVRAGE